MDCGPSRSTANDKVARIPTIRRNVSELTSSYSGPSAQVYWSRVTVRTVETASERPELMSNSGAPEWAGYTDDGVDQVIVASITVEHQVLAA